MEGLAITHLVALQDSVPADKYFMSTQVARRPLFLCGAGIPDCLAGHECFKCAISAGYNVFTKDIPKAQTIKK